jgi:hypothetical protein
MRYTTEIEKGESWSADVGIGLTAELMAIEVPSRVTLRFRKIGNYLGIPGAWGFCSWQILKNGIVVMTLMDQIGFAAQREIMTPILVQAGERISVNGINPTAGIVPMGITFTWDELGQG